ncbi:MAG TPA: DUF1361 domain-containing protein, partial [Pirellulales bacterium]|jgi:uncharacterized membrane protein
MPDTIRGWVHLALQQQFHLVWNLFLALVPLALAFYLFRHTNRRGWLWWPLLIAFVLFLPNAAYTVTDIIHFIEDVRYADPMLPEWSIVWIVIPKYAAFIVVGFQSHVISLICVGNYLRWLGHKKWVVPAELTLNFLCAIGVYWGRYLRFNSWDVLNKPYMLAQKAIASLNDEIGVRPVLRYFIAFTAAYYLVKWIDIAMWEHWQLHRLHKHFPARVAAWIPKRNAGAPAEQEPL